MEINDTITVNLEGIGKASATAVKKENGQTWYVFDRKIGDSTLTDMRNFLSDLVTKFPQPLQDRLHEIRLLDASEVFSDCDDPEEWEFLLNMGIKMERPQIPYFKSVECRHLKYQLYEARGVCWLNSANSQSVFVGIDNAGSAFYGLTIGSYGVCPLFVLNDMED